MHFKCSSISWLLRLDLFNFKTEKKCSQRYLLLNIESILAALIFNVRFFHPSILSKKKNLVRLNCKISLEELNILKINTIKLFPLCFQHQWKSRGLVEVGKQDNTANKDAKCWKSLNLNSTISSTTVEELGFQSYPCVRTAIEEWGFQSYYCPHSCKRMSYRKVDQKQTER